MKKVLTIYFISVFILCSCDSSNQKGHTTNEYSAISKFPTENGDSISIDSLILQKGLKGLSVAVFEDYKIIWTDTWGVKYDSIPLDINTAFSTASISKPITALLFAILEEKGLIKLDIPVNNYLKRWQLPKSKYTENTDITLEHLLSHTAGTSQHGFTDFYDGDQIPSTLESVQGKIPSYNNEEIKITFIPGSNWKYSGGGYTIAMMALEDHLEKSIADLAQEYLFGPLSMKNTTMKQPNEKGFFKNVAKAHDKNGNIVHTGIPITPQVSASGLWSTPEDMANLLIDIQKGLNGLESKVISKNVAKRITDIVTLKVMRGWSLGWERRHAYGNLDWFSHGGANTGIGGHIYATMKNGKGIVLLANGPNAIRIPITDLMRDNIINTYRWKLQLDTINKKELPSNVISKIIGRYQDLNFGEIFKIEENEGQLFIPKYFSGQRNDLIYIGDNSFIINEVSGKFKFIDKNDSIKIEYFRDSSVHSEALYEKIKGKLPYELALENSYEEALNAYQNLKNKIPQSYVIQESTINSFGYEQLGKEKYKIALTIFKINSELYPHSANAFDSLAETYMLSGDNSNAIKYYKKSLELNPRNANAIKMIDNISKP